MQIDPHGWWVTLPILAGMLWAYFQPADHAVKAFWRHLVRSEAQGLASITGHELWRDEARAGRAYRWLFWVTTIVLALASLGSVGAYLGLLPSA